MCQTEFPPTDCPCAFSSSVNDNIVFPVTWLKNFDLISRSFSYSPHPVQKQTKLHPEPGSTVLTILASATIFFFLDIYSSFFLPALICDFSPLDLFSIHKTVTLVKKKKSLLILLSCPKPFKAFHLIQNRI